MNRFNRTLCLSVVFGLTFIGLVGYVFQLRTGFQIDPILFQPFGLFPIYWYGIIVLIAISLGFWIATVHPLGSTILAKASIWQYAVSIVICGILGARIFDVIFPSPIAISQGLSGPTDYFENAVLLFDFTWGGLNIWGALLGGSLMLFWFCWRKNVPRVPIFFKAMIGLLVGLSMVQWGHFINQELYGFPSAGWGSIFIEPAHRIEAYADSDRFVPLFLFAAVWYLMGGLWLFFGRRWQYSTIAEMDGIMVGLIWFTVGRLALELATPSSLFNSVPAVTLLTIIFAIVFSRNVLTLSDD